MIQITPHLNRTDETYTVTELHMAIPGQHGSWPAKNN
jgi:hypothetical protein